MIAAQSVCEHSWGVSTAVKMEGHTSMYACAALVCPVHRAFARDRTSAPCLWRRVLRRCMLKLRPVVSRHAQGCYRFTLQFFCFSSVLLRYTLMFTPVPHRFHFDFTSISLRSHFDITSISLRFHFDFTSSHFARP